MQSLFNKDSNNNNNNNNDNTSNASPSKRGLGRDEGSMVNDNEQKTYDDNSSSRDKLDNEEIRRLKEEIAKKELREQARLNLDTSLEEMDKLALLLSKSLSIGVNRRRVHAYENTFTGTHAVEWMVANGISRDAAEAKIALRRLILRKIIKRADHSRPMFNDILIRVTPSLAVWRKQRLESIYQERETELVLQHLYKFNITAFARYDVVVTIHKARNLRYARRSLFRTGKMEYRKINPYVHVSLGSSREQEFSTIIIHSGDDAVWEEEFEVQVDPDNHDHQYLWIRVKDFQEIIHDSVLGVISIPISMIFQQCEVPNHLNPSRYSVNDGEAYDGKRAWRAWHVLNDPPKKDKDVLVGGEVDVEFEVHSHKVIDPEQTIYPSARISKEELLQKVEINNMKKMLAAGVNNDTSRQESLDTTLMNEELALAYKNAGNQKNDANPATEADKNQNTGNDAANPTSTSVVSSSGKKAYMVKISSVTFKEVSDIPDGQFFWLEVSYAGRKVRSPQTLWSTAQMSKKNRKSDVEDFALRGFNSSNEFAARDGRLTFTLYKNFDLISMSIAKGTFPTRKLEKFSEEDEEILEAANSPGASPEIKEKANKLLQRASCTIVLKRQAIFKRDVKKKSGEISLNLYIAKYDPTLGSDLSLSADDTGEESGEGNENEIILEDSLAALRSVGDGQSDAEFKPPTPLANTLVETEIPCSLGRLGALMLSVNSKFITAYYAKRGITELKMQEWESVPSSQPQPSLSDAPPALLPLTQVYRQISDSSQIDDKNQDSPPTPSVEKSALGNESIFENNNSLVSATGSLLKSPNEGAIQNKKSIYFQDENSVQKGDPDSSKEPSTTSTDVISKSNDDDSNKSSEQQKTIIPASNIQNSISLDGEEESKANDVQLNATATQAKDNEESIEIKSTVVKEIQIPQGSVPQTKETFQQAESILSSPPEHKISKKRSESLDSSINRKESLSASTLSTRKVEFMIPPSSFVGALKCIETQKILQLQPKGFVIEAIGSTPDAPYGDTFSTKILFVGTYVSDNKSKLQISAELVFSKSPGMVKGIIESKAKQGLKESYGVYEKLLKSYVAASMRGKGGKSSLSTSESTTEDAEEDEKNKRFIDKFFHQIKEFGEKHQAIVIAVVAIIIGILIGISSVYMLSDRKSLSEPIITVDI